MSLLGIVSFIFVCRLISEDTRWSLNDELNWPEEVLVLGMWRENVLGIHVLRQEDKSKSGILKTERSLV